MVLENLSKKRITEFLGLPDVKERLFVGRSPKIKQADDESRRMSRFRGVSKNGHKW